VVIALVLKTKSHSSWFSPKLIFECFLKFHKFQAVELLKCLKLFKTLVAELDEAWYDGVLSVECLLPCTDVESKQTSSI
jgi:hypothetical protein